MVRKAKTKPAEVSDTELFATIQESANNIWLAGLGAFAKTQEEGGKVFDALVKEGEVVQKRAKKAADDTVAGVSATATGAWDKLEKVFEDRVARALHSLNVPTKKDIDALSKRVTDLTKTAEKLSAQLQDKEKKKPAAPVGKRPSTTRARKTTPRATTRKTS